MNQVESISSSPCKNASYLRLEGKKEEENVLVHKKKFKRKCVTDDTKEYFQCAIACFDFVLPV